MGRLEAGPEDAAALAKTHELAELGMMTATILHELKQPLSGIKGFVQMLLAGDPDPARRCQLILGQVQRLEELIDSGQRFLQPRVSPGPTDLREVAREAARLFEPRLRQAGIALQLSLPEGPVAAEADASQVLHAVTNLVANAIDAVTEKGGGSVEILLRQRDGAAELFVADTGAGIAVGSEGRLFAPFFTTKGAEKGFGLGLYLSRWLARANGATLERVAPSEAGLKATTVFRLRFAPRTELTGASVLVVDDEEVVCELLTGLLEPEGLKVHCTRSGPEALQLIKERHFDLVISDKNLPGATGLDIARAVRERYPECPVILITGYSSLESAQEALQIGIHDYLEKPFDDIARVRERVLEVLRASPPALEPALDEPSRQVLVISAQAKESTRMAEAITAAGGTPVMVGSIREAQTHMRPDTAGVVVSDEMLVEGTGVVAARSLRSQGRVPLVVVTEGATLERTVAAIRLGAVALVRSRAPVPEIAQQLKCAFSLGKK